MDRMYEACGGYPKWHSEHGKSNINDGYRTQPKEPSPSSRSKWSSTSLRIAALVPGEAKASISHVEKAKLGNGLVPKKHMCVSTFQHNLLSVQRLIADSKCEVVKGTSKAKDGLYYLNNDVSEFLSSCMNSSHDTGHEFNLWHNRLGHASLSKLKYIDCVKPFLNSKPKN
ncbi:Copia protein, partial [Bienertia sinuspersici]